MFKIEKKVFVTTANYREHLPLESRCGAYMSPEDGKRLASLTLAQASNLLREIIAVFSSVDEWRSYEADAFALETLRVFRRAGNENLHQKEIDDAVSKALAKCDKTTIDAVEKTSPDKNPLNGYHNMIRGLTAKTIPSMKVLTPAQSQSILDDLTSGKVVDLQAIDDMANMNAAAYVEFFPRKIPESATPQQVYDWASLMMRALWGLSENHPTYTKICKEIDAHQEQVYLKETMQGVVTEMVRPSSINKKPKTK